MSSTMGAERAWSATTGVPSTGVSRDSREGHDGHPAPEPQVVPLFPGTRPGTRVDHGRGHDGSVYEGSSDELADPRLAEYAALARQQLELLGEDPTRDGLVKTPERMAKAMAWLTRGYGLDARQVIGDALFEVESEQMVLVRDIELYSLCEHHLLPFFGKAHVAYIPDGRVVGLSKLARVVDVFAQRLQVQERLTEDIAGALDDVLRPRGVGVVIEAAHMCMMMRGVSKQSSMTVTSALRGGFRTDGRTRDEFLRLAHSPTRA